METLQSDSLSHENYLGIAIASEAVKTTKATLTLIKHIQNKPMVNSKERDAALNALNSQVNTVMENLRTLPSTLDKLSLTDKNHAFLSDQIGEITSNAYIQESADKAVASLKQHLAP